MIKGQWNNNRNLMSRFTPTIRPETPEDSHAVRRLLLAAFPSDDEAVIVDELRSANALVVSLVAVDVQRSVVGHIGFSPVTIRPQPSKPCRILGLAPLSVAPDVQKCGVGSSLVTAGIRACEEVGCEAVVVLGDPAFYGRFGFRPAAGHGLRCLFDAPPEAFTARVARPDALPMTPATVHFHSTFDRFLGMNGTAH